MKAWNHPLILMASTGKTLTIRASRAKATRDQEESGYDYDSKPVIYILYNIIIYNIL
jgi:hypothetical protein